MPCGPPITDVVVPKLHAQVLVTGTMFRGLGHFRAIDNFVTKLEMVASACLLLIERPIDGMEV